MDRALVDARRVLVAGASGAGKSTLVRRIADAIGTPYTELDALHPSGSCDRRSA